MRIRELLVGELWQSQNEKLVKTLSDIKQKKSGSKKRESNILGIRLGRWKRKDLTVFRR